jgi:hypothetical protein
VGIDWYYTDKAGYIDQKYAWARIASDFFAGVDYAGEGFSYLSTSDVSLGGETVSSSNNQLRALAMRSNDRLRAYVWVHHKAYISKNGTSETVSPASGNITLGGMAPGEYRIQYWNTHNGKMTNGETVLVKDGSISLPVELVRNDVAIKIISNRLRPTKTPFTFLTPATTAMPGTE